MIYPEGWFELVKQIRCRTNDNWFETTKSFNDCFNTDTSQDALKRKYLREIKGINEQGAVIGKKPDEPKPVKHKDFRIVDDCIYIIPISDLHLGDIYSNEQKFLGYRKWILDHENAYVLLWGDLFQSATKNTPPSVFDQTMSPNEQLKYGAELLKPIAPKVLGVIDGNHENWVRKQTSIEMTELLCDKLDINGCYRRDGLFLHLDLGKVNYGLYGIHGYGGGKRPGSKVNKLEDLNKTVNADIYVVAHTHFMTTYQDNYFVFKKNGDLERQKRAYVSAGSFQGWGGYAQRFGMPPSKLGTVRIRLNSEVKDVHVSV